MANDLYFGLCHSYQDLREEEEDRRRRRRRRERERERQTDRQTETEGDRDRGRQRKTERDRERQREKETDRQAKTKRDTDGQAETERDRDTDRERERETDRETEKETERERTAGSKPQSARHTHLILGHVADLAAAWRGLGVDVEHVLPVVLQRQPEHRHVLRLDQLHALRVRRLLAVAPVELHHGILAARGHGDEHLFVARLHRLVPDDVVALVLLSATWVQGLGQSREVLWGWGWEVSKHGA